MPAKPRRTDFVWCDIPLLRSCLAFVPGMMIANTISVSTGVWLTCVVICGLLSFVALNRKYRHLRLLVACAMCLSTGGVVATNWQDSINSLDNNFTTSNSFRATILETDTTRSGRQKLTLLPAKMAMNGPKVIAYSRDKASSFCTGDQVSFSNRPSRIKSDILPFEFDVGRYFEGLGISHQVYLSGDETPITAAPTILSRFNRARQYAADQFLRIIRENVKAPSAQSVVCAMVVGERGQVSNELKEMYKRSGAIHILAISGLHIGIIASIVLAITGIPNIHRGMWMAILKLIVILFMVWSFILVSGSSPSATRAGTMFTVFIIGKTLSRRASVLNILGFTCIGFLVCQPYLIHSISFQFSYLALFGIVTIGVPLNNIIVSRYRLLRFAWGTIAISIGAQALLLPAMFHYFNSTSLISPLSSLFAIPAAFVIVVWSLVTIAMGTVIPVLAKFSGLWLGKFILLLNTAISKCADLPFSMLHNTYLHKAEALLLSSCVLMFALYIISLDRNWLFAAVMPALAFAILHPILVMQTRSQSTLTVYPDKHMAIDIMHRGTVAALVMNPTDRFTKSMMVRNRVMKYSVHTDTTEVDKVQNYCIDIQATPGNLLSMAWISNHGFPPRLFKDVDVMVAAKSLRYKERKAIRAKCDSAGVCFHPLYEGAIQTDL